MKKIVGIICIMALLISSCTTIFAADTDITNTSSMRYLIVTGVNKTTHQLKIYDCTKDENNLQRWIDTSLIFNGGYISTDTNIKFLGSIIELSNN